jgi:prevent-host-death family protein
VNELTVTASEFKAKCLRLLDDVAKRGDILTITKHNRPIARVVPVSLPSSSLRGAWKDLVITGDIVHFESSEDWEAGH